MHRFASSFTRRFSAAAAAGSALGLATVQHSYAEGYEAPHLKVKKGAIPPIVLVAGDPGRIGKIAELCDDAKEVAFNREYRTVVATYKGHKIALVSHGIGTAGAGICFEELVMCGAETIVRLGTCGALQPNIAQGDLVIATAAAREDGTTKLMAPADLPAVADIDVVNTMTQVCVERGVTHHRGVVLTSDLFYPSVLPSSLKTYSKCGVIGVEMEVACLLMVAQLRGIQAGAVACVDGNPLNWDGSDSNYDPHGTVVAKGKERMLLIGLETAVKLWEQRSKK